MVVTGELIGVTYNRDIHRQFGVRAGLEYIPGNVDIQLTVLTTAGTEHFRCNPIDGPVLEKLPKGVLGCNVVLELPNLDETLWRILSVTPFTEMGAGETLNREDSPEFGGRSILLDYVHKEEKG